MGGPVSQEQQVIYQRLPGSGYYTTSSPSLIGFMFFIISIFVLTLYRRRLAYLGPDHVLTVDEEGYQEVYRFFNFKDIQAVRMMRTSSYPVWICVFSVKCALVLWLMFSVSDEVLSTILLAYASGLGLALLVHLVKGPTVSVRLETAVSVVELTNLGRLANAERAITEISAHTERVQGALEPEELGAKVDQLRLEGGGTGSTVPNIGKPAPRAATARPVVYSDYGGRWHRIAFRLLVADGLLTLATIVANGMAAILGGMVLYCGALIFAIIAYSRQSDSRLSRRVQKLTGWILAYMGLSILVGWIESIALSVKNPGLAVQQDRMLEHLASINAFEETWFLVHCLVFGIASLFLGMLGLLWARDHEKQADEAVSETPPEVPTKPSSATSLLADLESSTAPAAPDSSGEISEPDAPPVQSNAPEPPSADPKPPNV